MAIEPGVYRRPDGALEIGWRDETGRQRWRVVHEGIAAARALRRSLTRDQQSEVRRREREAEEERALVEAALAEAERAARVRANADLTDAYSYVRHAAQALDRADTSGRATLLKREAADALIRAEDLVSQAVREAV